MAAIIYTLTESCFFSKHVFLLKLNEIYRLQAQANATSFTKNLPQRSPFLIYFVNTHKNRPYH